MRLIDLDQTIFVPIIDESQGGVKYEVEMTVAEVFDKFFDGVQPEIVSAIPVGWLERKEQEMLEREDKFNYRRADSIRLVILMWQKEQGAHGT